MIAVVGEDAHAPVVRLHADAHEAERKLVLCIQPARLDVAEAVVVVARRLIRARAVRALSEEDAGEHVELADELELVTDLHARRDAQPVRDELVLADRVLGETGSPIDVRRGRDERERALRLVTDLMLAVQEESKRVRIGLRDLDATVVENEARQIARYVAVGRVDVVGEGRSRDQDRQEERQDP